MYRHLPNPDQSSAVPPSSPQEIRSFLDSVTGGTRFPNDKIVLVAHLRQGRTFSFVRTLAKIAQVRGVLPKPNGSDATEVERCLYDRPLWQWTREDMAGDPDGVVEHFRHLANIQPLGRVAICDIGGYFAPHIDAIHNEIGDSFAGVVEDTKNGEARYASLDRLPVPVISVAHSSNKVAENQSVGMEIVEATKLRLKDTDNYSSMSGALVIGQGPVGTSIRDAAEKSGFQTSAYDIAHGTNPNSIKELLSSADIVFCATGNKALDRSTFQYIKPGAEVALATSADDELDLEGLHNLYNLSKLDETGRYICQSKTGQHYFYLPDGLRAINFSISPLNPLSVVPLQAEIMLVTKRLLQQGFEVTGKVQPSPDDIQDEVARLFADRFGNEG